MKRILILLLVVACLVGLSSALGAFTPEPAVADGPVYPQPIVPPLPPGQNNIIITGDGPVYPQPIVPPLPPDQNSIIIVADGPVYPQPIVPPLPPSQNSITG